jgi:hypothetical protein
MSWSSCELLSKGKLTETCLHKITDTLRQPAYRGDALAQMGNAASALKPS